MKKDNEKIGQAIMIVASFIMLVAVIGYLAIKGIETHEVTDSKFKPQFYITGKDGPLPSGKSILVTPYDFEPIINHSEITLETLNK